MKASRAQARQRAHEVEAGAGSTGPPKARRHWWPWIKRALTLAFFGAVLYFVVRYARTVDWGEVWGSIINTPPRVLWTAAGLSVCTHLLYSCMDLLGRHYTGHHLPARKVMQVNFISYAFNLNFGAAVGAIAFRLRLYSRLGLDSATITRVISLSMLSNWLGYLVLAGLAFTVAPLPTPPEWGLGSGGLRALGIALLATAGLYIGMCVFSGRRSYTVRGHELLLPPPRMVAAQLGIACGHWMAMASMLYVLLGRELPYPTVLSVMLVGAIAGVIAHVPAGLGVLEAVFIALLSHRIPEWRLIGVLLTYRAIYYIGPLLLAFLLYFFVEARAKRTRQRAQAKAAARR